LKLQGRERERKEGLEASMLTALLIALSPKFFSIVPLYLRSRKGERSRSQRLFPSIILANFFFIQALCYLSIEFGMNHRHSRADTNKAKKKETQQPKNRLMLVFAFGVDYDYITIRKTPNPSFDDETWRERS